MTKVLDDFPKHKLTKSGRLGTCRECSATMRRKWAADHKDYMYQYMKRRKHNNKDRILEFFGHACAHCGLMDEPCVYDLHHLNPLEKEDGISRMMDRKWETILPELQKCILLCSNCHRKVHFSRKSA